MKKKLPSTWPLDPQHGTLDKKIDSTKCIGFNSRFWNPESEGVDAFIQNWQGENNWVVPAPSQIIRAWRHFELCKAKGVIILQ